VRIIGCDLHARQQTLAMLDTNTGEVVNRTLQHEGNNVREFYSNLAKPVRGIEATGSMQWFVNLMEELGIECLVGHPAEGRFPAIWLPTKELMDLRALLRHRHQWVKLRVKCKMRCRPLPWCMASDEVPHCGRKQANRRSHLYRCRRMPRIGGMSRRRCMQNSQRRSRN
jgi:hypothetical protein